MTRMKTHACEVDGLAGEIERVVETDEQREDVQKDPDTYDWREIRWLGVAEPDLTP